VSCSWGTGPRWKSKTNNHGPVRGNVPLLPRGHNHSIDLPAATQARSDCRSGYGRQPHQQNTSPSRCAPEPWNSDVVQFTSVPRNESGGFQARRAGSEEPPGALGGLMAMRLLTPSDWSRKGRVRPPVSCVGGNVGCGIRKTRRMFRQSRDLIHLLQLSPDLESRPFSKLTTTLRCSN